MLTCDHLGFFFRCQLCDKCLGFLESCVPTACSIGPRRGVYRWTCPILSVLDVELGRNGRSIRNQRQCSYHLRCLLELQPSDNGSADRVSEACRRILYTVAFD